MKLIRPGELEQLPNPYRMDVKQFFAAKEMDMLLLTLKPGEKMLKHITYADVLFYLVKGQGVAEANGSECAAVAGEALHSPEGTVHRWRNEGTEDLVLMIIRFPAPTRPPKMIEE